MPRRFDTYAHLPLRSTQRTANHVHIAPMTPRQPPTRPKGSAIAPNKELLGDLITTVSRPMHAMRPKALTWARAPVRFVLSRATTRTHSGRGSCRSSSAIRASAAEQISPSRRKNPCKPLPSAWYSGVIRRETFNTKGLRRCPRFSHSISASSIAIPPFSQGHSRPLLCRVEQEAFVGNENKVYVVRPYGFGGGSHSHLETRRRAN